MGITFNPGAPPVAPLPTLPTLPTGDELQTTPSGNLGDVGTPPPPGAADGSAGDTPSLPPPAPDVGGISLPASINVSDMIAAVARLLVEQQQEGKETARADRQHALAMDQEALQRVADEIRSQAAFELAATVVSSAISIAGSVVQLRGAVRAQNALSNNVIGPKVTDLPETTPSASPVPAEAAVAQYSRSISDKYTGVGQVTTQVGNIAGGAVKIGAAEQEAEKAEAQADSTKMQTAADQEKEFIQAYADMIRFVLDKLSEAQSQEAQTNRQIVTG